MFIRILAIIVQVFLFFTASGSYFNSKFTTHHEITEGQKRYYCKSIDNLLVKIDNLFYLLDNSGAIKLCSDNSALRNPIETMEEYNKIKTILSNSVLSNRYFSGYYIIGKNTNQFSFYKINDEFSEIGTCLLEYSKLINNNQYNGFSKNYQKIHIFDKSDYKDISIDEHMQEQYNHMLNTLDGQIVYTTLHKDTLCIIVINPQYLDTLFEDAKLTNTSVALVNKQNNVLYIKSDSNSFIDTIQNQLPNHYFKYSTDMCTLITDSGINYTLTDISFIILMFVCCILIILWAFHVSKKYATAILEPYRVLKGFFGLNYTSDTIEEFDYLDYHYPTKKRSDISKNIFKAFVFAILLPSSLSAILYLISLNLTTQHFIEEKTSVIHLHLVQEFYDNFDFYISSTNSNFNVNSENSEYSRLKYTVVLDNNFSLISQPFATLDYMSSSNFNKQLKNALKDSPVTGTLINISSDLFGDHALASVYHTENNKYLCKIFKSETFGNVIADTDIGFAILDKYGNIVTQNVNMNDAEKQKVINGDKHKIIYKTEMSGFNWSLYSFSEYNKVKSSVYSTIIIDIIAILTFLLIILLIAWRYSTRFLRPLERIKAAMAEVEADNQLKHLETNEIEEILTVYNKMVKHIKKITDEKIQLTHEEEKINILKIRAELNAFQQQINPHFLYNTLEMINLNVLNLGDINTSKVIGTLSKIFRYAISSSTETVLLSEEIENSKNYLSIWAARFPDRYEFIWDIDVETQGIHTLKLILQPLMENSLYHAFDNVTTHCIIRISAQIQDDFVIITVTDNGRGIEQADLDKIRAKLLSKDIDLKGKGIGLCNIYKRLKLFYGESADILIDSEYGKGTSVHIKFPLI